MFKLTESAGERLGRVTQANVGRSLAIVHNDSVISAPTIQAAIAREGVIHGDFTQQEVADLAAVLQAGRVGPLPAPVRVIETQEISGEAWLSPLRTGFLASVAALIVTAASLALVVVRRFKTA